MDIYSLMRPLLMRLDPETAHRMTIAALKAGLVPRYSCQSPLLETSVFGLKFPNPLGLAAGFDKDAEAPAALLGMGFGFVEVGTVTPRAQGGNPRPRVFRDPTTCSVVNRMGFPGKGIVRFRKNVVRFRQEHSGILGLNIGMNRDTALPLEDYRAGIRALADVADYITINISSPNTAGLRDLQAQERLDGLLAGIAAERKSARPDLPVLLKVAPDLTPGERAGIAGTVLCHGIDGLIVSNTTVARPAALDMNVRGEKGGLSGPLLREAALDALRDFYRLTEGCLPIVGAGGISSAADAYERIRAGASLVQVYTGLVYQGPGLIRDILEGVACRLEEDGFSHVSEAVGADAALHGQKGKMPVSCGAGERS